MRSGIIAKKVGMSTMYNEHGVAVPVTLLKYEKCQVVTNKTVEKHGYNAVQIGVGEIKQSKVKKPLKGYFNKNGIQAKRILQEFRVSNDCLLNSGDIIGINHFVENQYVDVSSVSIGKGFAGVMKRWNFAGLKASHGVSISHRSHGSTGQCQDPGKVMKGKKMAGQLGNVNTTLHNLIIVKIINEHNLIAVKGTVPGSKGSYITLKDAVKKSLPVDVPYPAFIVNKRDSVSQNSDRSNSDQINSAAAVETKSSS